MLNTTFYYILMFAVVGVPFYFHHRASKLQLEGVRATDADAEIATRINGITARLTVFIIASLYLMSFIAINLKNTTFQEFGYFASLFSFFILHTQHAKIINRIQKSKITPQERFQTSIRNLSIFILFFGIYYVFSSLIPHLGLITFLLMLVCLNYFIPLFVRLHLDARAMHPSEIKTEIMNVFTSAGNPVGNIYLIDHRRIRGANAFICGPKYGFGPFQRSLFVTKNLFEALEPDEIHAVICHEAAHFKKNHLFKRAMMSFFSFVVAAVSISFPIFFIGNLIPIGTASRMMVYFLATTLTVIAQLVFLFRLIRKQEFEADLEALTIGATVGSLISALEKLTIKNGVSRKKATGLGRFIFFEAHPSIEERVEAIRTRTMPTDSRVLPTWQLSLTYASFVILSTSLALLYQNNRIQVQKLDRNVASVKQESTTRQILPTLNNPVKPDTRGADE
jgi:Zn-dependent protease with chaperone function